MGQVQECVDGPRLLRMRLGESVPHSLGWNSAVRVGGGLASLPSLHSLARNCTLGVGG